MDFTKLLDVQYWNIFEAAGKDGTIDYNYNYQIWSDRLGSDEPMGIDDFGSF